MAGSLYTPFAAQAMGQITGALEKRDIGRAAKAAYMGDPAGLEELYKLDPAQAQSIQAYQDKQQQLDLTNQRNVAKDEDAQRAAQQEWAINNKELMDDLMSDISYFTDPAEAAAFADTEIQRLRDAGFEGVPDMELTPEVFAQIKQANMGRLGENQETVGGTYMVTRPNADTGVDEIVTATAVRNKKTGKLEEVILEGARQRVSATHDPERAQAVAKAKKTGTITAEIDLADDAAFSELRAEAKVGLRPARRLARSSIKTIEELRNHPGREAATGLSNWLDPRRHVPGTDAHDFSIMADQAMGQIFNEAYQTLKGGGPITEIESAKASAAFARMEQSATEAEYLRALDDFENAVRDGYANMLADATATKDSVMADTDLDAAGSINNPIVVKPGDPKPASGTYVKLPSGKTIRVP